MNWPKAKGRFIRAKGGPVRYWITPNRVKNPDGSSSYPNSMILRLTNEEKVQLLIILKSILLPQTFSYFCSSIRYEWLLRH
jgi:hypothetical protein